MNVFLFGVTSLPQSADLLVCCVSFFLKGCPTVLAAPGDSCYPPSIPFIILNMQHNLSDNNPVILAIIHGTCGFCCNLRNFVHILQQIFVTDC